MTAQFRSTAINVWSSDKSSTLFKVVPAPTKTTVLNGGKPVEFQSKIKCHNASNVLVDPIEYAEELIKDSSGNTVSMDDIQTLLSDAIDASGNVVADHTQIENNKNDIAGHSLDIADLLARIITLEGQMSELSNS